ncbi:hypothetical protein V6N13_009161 [Hibiscus sabdariffa]
MLARRDIRYEVGDKVFLKVSPWKKVLRFGKKGKLSSRYIGPFEVIEKVGFVAYRLALPPEIDKIHNVFHVSMFIKYRSDPSHVLEAEEVELNPNLTYKEEPVMIFYREVKRLRNKNVSLVKSFGVQLDREFVNHIHKEYLLIIKELNEKLNGINFLDWFRNLRIVLKQERKEYVIKEDVPIDPGANASRADKDKYKKHMDDMLDVGCLMLATMTPELQKQHEDIVDYEMIQNLKDIYEGQARQERYETSKALFQCKMSEGAQVGAHVIKMMGYIQTLEKLGFALNNELVIDVILQSLPDSFNQFVLNFNMNEINKTLPQLLGMLRTAESNMKKGGSKSILMVREAKRKEKKVAKSKGVGTALCILKMSRRLKQLEHQSQVFML